MCPVTKVANDFGLVTAKLSQLAQTIIVVKNNYTKRKGAKVTILTCVKQKRKENKEQNNNNNKKQPNMAKTLMKQREKG